MADRFTLDFFYKQAGNPFVVKNKLMRMAIENLNLDDGCLQVFIHKLGMIQEMTESIEETNQRKENGDSKD